jgi:AraC family transcriptional regulator of adaptative response / DNA-3-methyladenine glycosylase II
VAPGSASSDKIDALVVVAIERIAEGVLNQSSLEELAAELGVTARHLRRAIQNRLGLSPIAMAQSRRLAMAKQLLHDTALPITTIAFTAGFRSVRRFNAVFAGAMGCAPSKLRRSGDPQSRITLRLDYRPPYDWTRMLEFLGARAIPGVESVGDGTYRRVVAIGPCFGEIAVRHATGLAALEVDVASELLPVAMTLVARVRRMFDLDARPDLINGALSRGRALALMTAARPGLRLPGAIDPFEATIRAMLGQQVSVVAATTLAGRFAAQLGTRCGGTIEGLTFRFPTPDMVVAAGVDRIVKIGMPMRRAAAIHAIAEAVVARRIRLDVPRDLESFVADLVEISGIGPWTAHYVAMRALHLPDAFPASDLGILKALGTRSAKAAEATAEAWRPYRSYAVMHLWTSLGESK